MVGAGEEGVEHGFAPDSRGARGRHRRTRRPGRAGAGQSGRRPGEGAHPRVRHPEFSDVQVKPRHADGVQGHGGQDPRYTGILMGTVQAGIAHGVLDAVRAEGIIPKKKANKLGIIYSVWLDPSILSVPEGEVDHAALFKVNREATAKVIRKAMRNEPTIDWLLENQESVTHYFHQLGLEGKL